jgi:argininosuccinate lyase
MPQKRNPRALENLRTIADTVIGDAQITIFQAHNSNSYMHDFRYSQAARNAAEESQKMYLLFGQTLESLYVDKDRAKTEVDHDYSTTSELADKLQQVANVPFRNGHHFASQLVDYGRARDLKPVDIPFPEAQRIYKEDTGQVLPLTETQFKDALSATHMISASMGIGGPQPQEVKRMLANELGQLKSDREWVKSQRTKLGNSAANLDKEFTKLIQTTAQ